MSLFSFNILLFKNKIVNLLPVTTFSYIQPLKKWKHMKGDDVIIVAPPSDNDAKTPGNP